MPEPDRDCPLCPRLVSFREQARQAEPTWFNAPVPTFGDQHAELIIVGLAPGLRGANASGRPFTGDYAGVLLYGTLAEFGWMHGTYAARPDDGISLKGCAITNAVRCVPPQNKPVPTEIVQCRPFLIDVFQRHRRARAVLSLGRIAHETVVRSLGGKPAHYAFGHGKRYDGLSYEGRPIAAFASYHCSRYNTNTRLLTTDMFRAVLADIRAMIDQPQP